MNFVSRIFQKNHKVTDCSKRKNKAYSENINLVKSKKLCFNCFLNPHTISNYKSKISCIAKGFQKRHHTLLHLPPVNKTSPVSPQSSDFPATINNETPEKNIQLQVSSHSIQNKTQVFLQKVPITLISNSYCLDTNALRDSGLDTTIIHKDIVKNLGLKGEKREISVSGATLQTEKIKSGLINVNTISEDPSNQI